MKTYKVWISLGSTSVSFEIRGEYNFVIETAKTLARKLGGEFDYDYEELLCAESFRVDFVPYSEGVDMNKMQEAWEAECKKFNLNPDFNPAWKTKFEAGYQAAHLELCALLEKAEKALTDAEDATAYASHDDSVGYRVCCQVQSFKPHEKGCKLNEALAAIKQWKEKT